MKCMTYNILDGSVGNLPLVIDVVNSESPDFLTINEANTFDKNNNALQKVCCRDKHAFTALGLSGIDDYHVAVVSKYQRGFRGK